MNDPIQAMLEAGGPTLSVGRSFDAYYFGPLAVVYFALMLGAALFKPECIRRRWLFRVSVMFFALFLLVPSVGDAEAVFGGPPSLNREARMLRAVKVRAESRPVGDLLAQVCLASAFITGVGAAGRPTPAESRGEGK